MCIIHTVPPFSLRSRLVLHNVHLQLPCADLVLRSCVCSLHAEQVVWALPQQQLFKALQQTSQGSTAAAAATAPAMQLLSPAFVLPCPAAGSSGSSKSGKPEVADQHVKTEWWVLLRQPARERPLDQ
jgi:hypothetical protein